MEIERFTCGKLRVKNKYFLEGIKCHQEDKLDMTIKDKHGRLFIVQFSKEY